MMFPPGPRSSDRSFTCSAHHRAGIDEDFRADSAVSLSLVSMSREAKIWPTSQVEWRPGNRPPP
jgi:predicted neuraminidase